MCHEYNGLLNVLVGCTNTNACKVFILYLTHKSQSKQNQQESFVISLTHFMKFEKTV